MKDKKGSLINFDFSNGLYTVPKQLDNGYLAIGKQKVEFHRVGGETSHDRDKSKSARHRSRPARSEVATQEEYARVIVLVVIVALIGIANVSSLLSGNKKAAPASAMTMRPLRRMPNR